ncbi:hypothetical protein [Parasitella parasitica]|uniref:Uncharacterized protein n=1 Tax=Parasitella parasitica TaxID=35722 RepID=A0A0B7MWI5_9FUNG|nr:hypothetical protein [Parasitella parasitica]
MFAKHTKIQDTHYFWIYLFRTILDLYPYISKYTLLLHQLIEKSLLNAKLEEAAINVNDLDTTMENDFASTNPQDRMSILNTQPMIANSKYSFFSTSVAILNLDFTNTAAYNDSASELLYAHYGPTGLPDSKHFESAQNASANSSLFGEPNTQSDSNFAMRNSDLGFTNSPDTINPSFANSDSVYLDIALSGTFKPLKPSKITARASNQFEKCRILTRSSGGSRTSRSNSFVFSKITEPSFHLKDINLDAKFPEFANKKQAAYAARDSRIPRPYAPFGNLRRSTTRKSNISKDEYSSSNIRLKPKTAPKFARGMPISSARELARFKRQKKNINDFANKLKNEVKKENNEEASKNRQLCDTWPIPKCTPKFDNGIPISYTKEISRFATLKKYINYFADQLKSEASSKKFEEQVQNGREYDDINLIVTSPISASSSSKMFAEDSFVVDEPLLFLPENYRKAQDGSTRFKFRPLFSSDNAHVV